MSIRRNFVRRLSRQQRERHVRQQREESDVLDTFVRRQPLYRRQRAERQILLTAPPDQGVPADLFDPDAGAAFWESPTTAATAEAGTGADTSTTDPTTTPGGPASGDQAFQGPLIPQGPIIPDVDPPQFDLPGLGAAATVLGLFVLLAVAVNAFARGAGRGAGEGAVS